MQKIKPFVWFNTEAREAAKLYTSIFPESKITSKATFNDTPSGSVEIIELELQGREFSFMNAGAHHPLNPAISFMVHCTTEEEVNRLYASLSEGGKVMMPLDTYPFSKRYAFIQDRFGVSWQLIYSPDQQPGIVPTLLFVGDNCGRAEEAIKLYISIFQDAKVTKLSKYKEDAQYGNKPGTVEYASFTLAGQEFTAMDGAGPHQFAFNDAISFLVSCKDQAEVDYFWEALSKGGEKVQCGWLKDAFGVSWQIIPEQLEVLLSKDTSGRVMQAMLTMVKIDIAELEQAYRGT